jgi:hypothetical protein
MQKCIDAKILLPHYPRVIHCHLLGRERRKTLKLQNQYGARC